MTITTSSKMQSPIKDTHFSPTSYPSTSEKHKNITDAVEYILAKDMCPISMVETEVFKKLINTLYKLYALPFQHYLTRVALPALYEKCCPEVASKVSKALCHHNRPMI